MTIGKKIRDSRKRAGLTASFLGETVGISGPTVSLIENDQLKGGPAPEMIIKIAEVLCDDSILTYYIETNPVYQHILPKIFPGLNNIRRDPAVIFTRIAREAAEASQSADIMAEIFSNADPRRVPQFDETFKSRMEQIVDIKRAVEFLEFELMATAIIDKPWLDDVYKRQQTKCIEHGHHVPEREEV
jgi:transcriptional regulator with XRE-family HTH domain